MASEVSVGQAWANLSGCLPVEHEDSQVQLNLRTLYVQCLSAVQDRSSRSAGYQLEILADFVDSADCRSSTERCQSGLAVSVPVCHALSLRIVDLAAIAVEAVAGAHEKPDQSVYQNHALQTARFATDSAAQSAADTAVVVVVVPGCIVVARCHPEAFDCKAAEPAQTTAADHIHVALAAVVEDIELGLAGFADELEWYIEFAQDFRKTVDSA